MKDRERERKGVNGKKRCDLVQVLRHAADVGCAQEKTQAERNTDTLAVHVVSKKKYCQTISTGV